MKYTMSMAASKDDLKQMILYDGEMTDIEKLHNIFAVDKEELKKKFPQLYYAILAVLDNAKKTHNICNPNTKSCDTCYRNEVAGVWQPCIKEKCPVFGKDFDDLAKTVVSMQGIRIEEKYLK